jgi:hypothetical protein
MNWIAGALLAAGIAGCAGTNATEHATAICVAAGYQQSDTDFSACVEDNLRLARAGALHRGLERATPSQVPQRTYFEGMSYDPDYHN